MSKSSPIFLGILLTLLMAVLPVKLSADGDYYFIHLAGAESGYAPGSADGQGSAARFSEPRALAVDKNGTVYVADRLNSTIRKITRDGFVTTLAGAAGQIGNTDGQGADARFYWPCGVAVDSEGYVYVADTHNCTIRKITPSGLVSTLAGAGPQNADLVDGTGTAAHFNYPLGIAVDAAGNLYVADSINEAIRKISPLGVVSTLAGGNWVGYVDGPGASAKFASPCSVAISASGEIYVGDALPYGVPTLPPAMNGVVRKVGIDGVTSTWAGTAQPVGGGRLPQPGDLLSPYGVAVDSIGNVFVADHRNNIENLRKISPSRVITTLNGGAGLETDGLAPSFYSVLNVAVDNEGNLYVADGAGSIRKGILLKTPTIVWPSPKAISQGTPLSETQLNATANVPGTFTYSVSNGSLLGAGNNTLSVTFTPTAVSTYRSVSAQVSLMVNPPDVFAGTYFGTFSNGHGNWALKVNSDNSADYIAYLSQRHSAVVEHLTLDVNGSFSVTGTEILPADAGGRLRAFNVVTSRQRTAAASYSLTGQITNGNITGQFAGLGETFSGTVDGATGSAPTGFYSAAALNTATGTTYAIVAASGQSFVLTSTSAGVDAATGNVSSAGQLSAATSGGGQISLTFSSSSHSLAAVLAPAGSGAPIKFSGLAVGTPSTTRLVNLSVRSRAGVGDQTLIMGFVISGDGTKQVLVRSLGPSLAGFGVRDALADPQLHLYNSSAIIDGNDNWGGGVQLTNLFVKLGAVSLPGNSKDAAVLDGLGSGVYSAHVTTVDSTTGIALAEIYDADKTGGRLVNVSARSEVRSGDNILIAGFVMEGNAPKTVLIRGLGPTLTALGVAGALNDPQLKVFDGKGGQIGANDDWGGTATMRSAFAAVGAVSLASSTSKDSALLMTLNPGVYSVQVSGVNGAIGVALAEIYEMP